MIDFGCGSGILAIAALKLGAAHAIGIDIDPQAITASRDNAQRNGVSERLSLYLQKTSLMTYKLMSWLLTSLLAHCSELAPMISVLPRPGGLLGLSGVLATQAEEVADAYRSTFEIDPVAEKKNGAGLRVSSIFNEFLLKLENNFLKTTPE